MAAEAGASSSTLYEWRRDSIVGRKDRRVKRLERALRRKEKVLAEEAALLALGKKGPSALGGRGRRHGPELRSEVITLVADPVSKGAGEQRACSELDICEGYAVRAEDGSQEQAQHYRKEKALEERELARVRAPQPQRDRGETRRLRYLRALRRGRGSRPISSRIGVGVRSPLSARPWSPEARSPVSPRPRAGSSTTASSGPSTATTGKTGDPRSPQGRLGGRKSSPSRALGLADYESVGPTPARLRPGKVEC